jgi:hypothetical protein
MANLLRYSWHNSQSRGLARLLLKAISTCFRLKTADKGTDDAGARLSSGGED